MSTNFDVVIIGSGPGGYVAAIKLSQLGFKVALVEKYSTLGGTCLNVGCIPSKAFLDSSERYSQIKHSSIHGIDVSNVSVKWDVLKDRVKKVVKQTSEGINYLMKKNAVTVINGHASFISPMEIQVESSSGLQKLSAKNFIIATGSKPTDLPNIKFDKKRIISSTEALNLPEIPKRLLVIGAGAIGLELGSVYSRLGAEVHVFEYAHQIIPSMDSDASKELSKVLKKEGMNIYTSTMVKSVLTTDNEVALTAVNLVDKSEIKVLGDYVLLAVGRRAYTDGLGLDRLEIKLGERGKIPVNDKLQTKHPHIYAIGDVIEGPMLAHKAEEEGIFVAEVLANQKPKLHHEFIPSVVYTWPEVASVGKTEEDLKSSNISYKKGIFPVKALGRARASEENFGFAKVLTHERSDEILGVHLVGPRAADLIAQVVTAMHFRASAEDIARICHAHPTYSEAIKEASYGAWTGKYIHL